MTRRTLLQAVAASAICAGLGVAITPPLVLPIFDEVARPIEARAEWVKR